MREWVSDGVWCQLLVSSFGLVKVQSRSRTVVVFSRVEVEMGRGGFYLGKVFYRLIYSLIGTSQSDLSQFHSPTPTLNSN